MVYNIYINGGNDMPSREERVNALAKFLEVEPETIQDGYTENLFETEDGEEYFVVTEDEGYELAKEDIEDVIDDLGVSAFSEGFQDWIMENAVDENFIDTAWDEEIEYIREDDEETAEEMENDYNTYYDKIKYFYDMFGEKEYSKWIVKNNALDIDTIVDECISWDGVAHFVASYDGVETELENNLFAYRTN